LTALLVNKIPLGPLPKIFPEFVGLLFFHLLSAQETTRKPHAVEADEMTRKSESNHPASRRGSQATAGENREVRDAAKPLCHGSRI
jgi:hypothetical protein